VLSEIRLAENDLSAALGQALPGGCETALWLRLAEACEPERSDDAVWICRDLLDGVIGRMSNDAYDEAARLLRKIGTLMPRQGGDRVSG
jgi:hypothetical protein